MKRKSALFATSLAIVAALALGLLPFNEVRAMSPEPQITFTFDVCNDYVYDLIAPAMDKHKIPAVLYGEIALLNSGEDWVMTWDEVRELRDTYGWEIGSHTINHPDLTTLGSAKLKKELEGSKKAFAAQGIETKTFATPYGSYNNKVLAQIAKYYESHRAAWGGPNIWPDYYDDYELVCYEIKHTTTTGEVKGWIEDAKANNQWLIFLMHGVTKEIPGEYEYGYDDFKEILEYVKDSGVKTVSISEGLTFSKNPNLVKNPSFEQIDSVKWAKNWTRTNKSKVKVNSNNQGNVSGVKNSLSIVGSSSQNEAVSDLVKVAASKDYLVRMYQNVQNLKKGGWAVYMSEFDKDQNWISGQWLGGNYENSVGVRYYEYQPTESNVEYAKIHIYTDEGSQLTLFVDDV